MYLSKGPTIFFSVQIIIQLFNHSNNKTNKKISLSWKDKGVTKRQPCLVPRSLLVYKKTLIKKIRYTCGSCFSWSTRKQDLLRNMMRKQDGQDFIHQEHLFLNLSWYQKSSFVFRTKTKNNPKLESSTCSKKNNDWRYLQTEMTL